MRDFAAAIGLVFAIEGMLMAGFTEQMRKRMAAPPARTRARFAGSASARPLVGVAIVWASRVSCYDPYG